MHETKLVDNCKTKCGINTYELRDDVIVYGRSFVFTYDAPTCLLCVTHDETPKAKTG